MAKKKKKNDIIDITPSKSTAVALTGKPIEDATSINLRPTKFDKNSPVIMVWNNRENQWVNFRHIDEVAEVFPEAEIYVAQPQLVGKAQRSMMVVK